MMILIGKIWSTCARSVTEIYVIENREGKLISLKRRNFVGNVRISF